MRPVLVPPTSLLNSSTDLTHKFLDPLLGFKEDAVSLKQPQQATQACLTAMLRHARGHTPETVPARKDTMVLLGEGTRGDDSEADDGRWDEKLH